MKCKNIFKWAGVLLISGLIFAAPDAFAALASDVTGIATNLTSTFGALGQLITAIAYIAGMGFALASIMKFKAHKDNPTQIPIGTPIALLFIAAALLFLPTLFGIAGMSIFGAGATTGGTAGVATFKVN